MVKRADIDGNSDFGIPEWGCYGEGAGTKGCVGSGTADRPECLEYDQCMWCERRLCKYVATEVFDSGYISEGPICRYCEDEGKYRTCYLYGGLEQGAIFALEEDYEKWKEEVGW